MIYLASIAALLRQLVITRWHIADFAERDKDDKSAQNDTQILVGKNPIIMNFDLVNMH